MSKGEFLNFLKRQQELTIDEEEASELKAEERVRQWKDDLDNLYTEVEEYLREYEAAGQISTYRETIGMDEERIGTYNADRLILSIGNINIFLEPKGAIIFGARGRVDVLGPKGTAKLVLVDKDSTKAGVHVSISIKDEGDVVRAAPEEKATEWVWKFATSPPTISLVELNEETLMETILEVTNA